MLRVRSLELADTPSWSRDGARLCAEGILGTGGGVPSNTCTEMGLDGVLAGPGIPLCTLPSAAPSDDRRLERRSACGVVVVV